MAKVNVNPCDVRLNVGAGVGVCVCAGVREVCVCMYVLNKRGGRMDEKQIQASIEKKVAEIKAHMPNTYASIKERAAKVEGTFALVRAALRGKPNCFYAIEAGRVMGTPFEGEIQRDLAHMMVSFGISHAVIWESQTTGVNNGTN